MAGRQAWDGFGGKKEMKDAYDDDDLFLGEFGSGSKVQEHSR